MGINVYVLFSALSISKVSRASEHHVEGCERPHQKEIAIFYSLLQLAKYNIKKINYFGKTCIFIYKMFNDVISVGQMHEQLKKYKIHDQV